MSLQRGESSSCAAPALDLYTTVGDVLVDMASVQYSIWDISTDAKRAEPVQVYPVGGGKATVNLAACPAGHRVGVGHYVGIWTVPDDEALGAHEIRWFFKLEAGGEEFTSVEEFDVVVAQQVGGAGFRGYCSVQDVRDEGVTVGMAADPRLERLIDGATREIDEFTGWWFESRALTLNLDGNDAERLTLPAPAISITSVTIDGIAVPTDYIKTYGSGPLLAPLREAPAIELVYGKFDRGRQNVVIVGSFGYTEADGSASGRTPARIRDACAMMVLKRALPAGDADDVRNAHRIQSMRTRTQSVSFFAGRAGEGIYTGDPEIDGILKLYHRPPDVGAA